MGRRVLWICGNRDIADARALTLTKSRPRFYEDEYQRIITPGASLTGSGYDEIILDGWDPDDGDTPLIMENGREWFDFNVRCRLFPGGTIYKLVPMPHLE